MDNDIDIIRLHERVATLENTVSTTLQDIQTKVNTFHDEMTRYKGMVGGITLIGSGLLILFGFFKDWIFGHLK